MTIRPTVGVTVHPTISINQIFSQIQGYRLSAETRARKSETDYDRGYSDGLYQAAMIVQAYLVRLERDQSATLAE
jgi:hypothetical protein